MIKAEAFHDNGTITLGASEHRKRHYVSLKQCGETVTTRDLSLSRAVT